MGTITQSIDSETEATVFTVEGRIEAEQVLGQIRSFLTGEPTPRVLWDISQGTLNGINGTELRGIVETGAPLAVTRAGGRTAIVCSAPVDFGLARMFQTFAELEGIPFHIRVFSNATEAKAWLTAG